MSARSRREVDVVVVVLGYAETAPLVLREVAVVDVDDAGELAAEDLGDDLEGGDDGVGEGAAPVAEQDHRAQALAIVVAREDDDARVAQPVGVLGEEALELLAAAQALELGLFLHAGRDDGGE